MDSVRTSWARCVAARGKYPSTESSLSLPSLMRKIFLKEGVHLGLALALRHRKKYLAYATCNWLTNRASHSHSDASTPTSSSKAVLTIQCSRRAKTGLRVSLSDSVELNINDHEMPPLIGDNEENNLTLQLSADDVIVKTKL
ncbi:hypothetical protein B0H14DRAFT_2626043 [Mycena olivaceomarginata]|nr:hypothetical protein B0H14DRAFT_2626043 [Mycena olivaceomarginata]